jgi:glycosyltransferase involved in cell wall biosynthesis
MVMPSLKEGFGVAALEAAACGRPVIASDVGGIPEVLVDKETGIMVPVNDVDRLAEAIIMLARDAEMRDEMGRSGYEFVKQNFTWEMSLDMMTALYRKVLDECQ